ncbi:hypothetical protein DZC30_02310 [Comamonas testosteroni]|uniref:Uncharacterized protein n=1 Tax=Comamonas testosteroni TaxID=285 RepID=A0A373FT95_COMTE|nr:hypothetical protein DZC30_02310 [Comamonas testosteroni]
MTIDSGLRASTADSWLPHLEQYFAQARKGPHRLTAARFLLRYVFRVSPVRFGWFARALQDDSSLLWSVDNYTRNFDSVKASDRFDIYLCWDILETMAGRVSLEDRRVNAQVMRLVPEYRHLVTSGLIAETYTNYPFIDGRRWPDHASGDAWLGFVDAVLAFAANHEMTPPAGTELWDLPRRVARMREEARARRNAQPT